MNIIPFGSNHIEEAAGLALAGYSAERQAVSILPSHAGDLDGFMRQIESFVNPPAGLPAFAAVERGKLLGFLAGYPVDEFFSSHPGVYVPLCGHAAAGRDRRLVWQRLYAEASGAWVGEGRLMHVVSMFAHDREAVDAWYWLGFGLRCVDAIRPLSAVDTAGTEPFDIRKAAPADAGALYPLHTEHCGYYRGAPLFMPHVDVEGSLPEFRQWLSEEGHHLWAAYAGGKPVSYMRVRHGGETFVSDDPKMVNICGAFTTPSARGTGAGARLLAAIVDWARERGCERLGVDCESFNVAGSRFWMKHFTPFMLSATRFIDDRILDVSHKGGFYR